MAPRIPSHSKPLQDLSVSLDPDIVQQIDPHGIPVGTPGHCTYITPLISAREVEKVGNPIGKGVAMASNALLTVVDTSLNFLFDGAEAVDHLIFRDRVDNYTGINSIQTPQLQSGARWIERGLGLTVAVAGYRALRSKNDHYGSQKLYNRSLPAPNHFKVGYQGAKNFWGKHWPIASVIFLAGTGAATEVGKGIDAIDPDHKWLKGESRTYARWAGYGLMFLGSALLLNYPVNAGYRRVVAPDPKAGPPLGARAGFMWAGLYYILGPYWTNWSSQVRVQNNPLSGAHSTASLYNPINWDWDLFQIQTEAAHAIVWGFSGYLWAALHATQTKVTDRISKRFLKFGSEVLAMTDAEKAYISGGRYAFTRGLRGVQMRLLTKRRAAFTVMSALAGLPMGVGIGQLIERASKYDSSEAKSGTPFRALITGPAGTAGMTFMTASRGYVRAWESYAFNMVPINWTWSACSRMGENLYQAARPLAEDYKNTDDAAKQRHIRSKLFKLYTIAYDDHDHPDPEIAKLGGEKAKIAKVMAEAGIDVAAVAADLRAKAIKYAAPSPKAFEERDQAADALHQYLQALQKPVK